MMSKMAVLPTIASWRHTDIFSEAGIYSIKQTHMDTRGHQEKRPSRAPRRRPDSYLSRG